MKVHVVVQNDFPHSVFATRALAEKHVAAMPTRGLTGSPIYWRIYPFTVEGYVPPSSADLWAPGTYQNGA